jgi:hypothetical protein
MEISATVEGHTLTNLSELTSETLSLEVGYPNRRRVTFIRQEAVFDGAAQPTIAGTFEVGTKNGVLDIAKPGGSVTPTERAFFTGGSQPTNASDVAYDRFLGRSFEVGQVFALTPDEIVGFGLKATSVELTVERVIATEVSFAIKLVGELPKLGTVHAHGSLRVFEHGQELSQDGEIDRDGKPLGSMHLSRRVRAL